MLEQEVAGAITQYKPIPTSPMRSACNLSSLAKTGRVRLSGNESDPFQLHSSQLLRIGK
jgi:hypothetical protein